MGVLDGVKVIEVAGIGPGPFAAMVLADLGADVVRVDRPAGGRGLQMGSPGTDVLARSRRSVALDLKAPEGRELAARPRPERRRAPRGLPARRRRTARVRTRRVPGPQRAPRLRPHDRVGPGRSERAQRAGHDLTYLRRDVGHRPARPHAADGHLHIAGSDATVRTDGLPVADGTARAVPQAHVHLRRARPRLGAPLHRPARQHGLEGRLQLPRNHRATELLLPSPDLLDVHG